MSPGCLACARGLRTSPRAETVAQSSGAGWLAAAAEPTSSTAGSTAASKKYNHCKYLLSW